MWTRMREDPAPVLPLGNAVVTVDRRAPRRFGVDTASLELLPRGRVNLRFKGPQGSATVAMSRTRFWQLTAVFHEQSTAAQNRAIDAESSRRKRRRRS